MYHELPLNETFLPVLFKFGQETDKAEYSKLISEKKHILVLDLFASQKQELFKVRSPKQRLSSEDTEALYNTWAADIDVDNEGVWVYYPWLGKVIHILDKDEFIELRTSRNQFKITPKEQTSLFNRKIGIIGLSVGHAVAISIATERICSKLKLADFDTIELSNLNRIKTGIQNIGLNKCVVTAREIAEIDPFLEIECYQEGITEDNLEHFLLDDGKLDILIDECDGLEIKIACRQMAKKYQIPVVMETSDKGMLDVERFDLENDRPILHGFLEGIPEEKLKKISPEDRLPLILKIIDAKNSSLRGQLSLLEIGQTISTWPQLASAVTLGGGVVTDVCRRILLDQYNESGRYYVDLESIIGNKKKQEIPVGRGNPYEPFTQTKAVQLADAVLPAQISSSSSDSQIITELVKAASLAPSNGNDQPWKWLYRNGRLYLFHDLHRSFSFAGFNQILPEIAIGAAFENLVLKANEAGLKIKSQLFPLEFSDELVSVIDFYASESTDGLNDVYAPESVKFIEERCTNRNPTAPSIIPDEEIAVLKEAGESVPGVKLHYIDDKNKVLALGEIIGACERINLLNEEGHKDFYKRDVRWNPTDAEQTGDGVDVRSLGMVPAQFAAYSIIADPRVAQTLKNIDGGNVLVDGMIRSAGMGAGIGILTISGSARTRNFSAGVAMQRLLLKAHALDYAIYPFSAPVHLFARLSTSDNGLDTDELQKLKSIREKFLEIIPTSQDQTEAFIFKIGKAPAPVIKSTRLPISDILFIENNPM